MKAGRCHGQMKRSEKGLQFGVNLREKDGNMQSFSQISAERAACTRNLEANSKYT
jgi:hypothetical protein